MKQVYDCEQSISLAPRHDFQPTSIWYHLRLLDDEGALDNTTRIYYTSFVHFFDAVLEGKVRNAKAYQGLFKQPKIKVQCGVNSYTITKRNFKEICVWNFAKDVSHLPITTIAKELSADEFAEYLRERGVTYQI